MNGALTIENLTSADRDWFHEMSRSIGGPIVVSRGVPVDLLSHPTRVVRQNGKPVGLLTFRRFKHTTLKYVAMEILAIKALILRNGIGSLLLKDAESQAILLGCSSIILDTTNDNTPALAFYHRHSFRVTHWHRGGFARVLTLKGHDPGDVVLGHDGVPITDVIRLRRPLQAKDPF